MEGYWWFKDVPHEMAVWLDTPELEALVIPANFLVFNIAGCLPSQDSSMALCIHGDGLAAVKIIQQIRVKNRKMRYIMERTLALQSVKERLQINVISQDYGLGNTGADALSRNHIE